MSFHAGALMMVPLSPAGEGSDQGSHGPIANISVSKWIYQLLRRNDIWAVLAESQLQAVVVQWKAVDSCSEKNFLRDFSLFDRCIPLDYGDCQGQADCIWRLLLGSAQFFGYFLKCSLATNSHQEIGQPRWSNECFMT